MVRTCRHLGREPKAGVKNLWPLGLMKIRNCLNVSRKAKSYHDITDNNGKKCSLCPEEAKLFVQHLFSLWKEIG